MYLVFSQNRQLSLKELPVNSKAMKSIYKSVYLPINICIDKDQIFYMSTSVQLQNIYRRSNITTIRVAKYRDIFFL